MPGSDNLLTYARLGDYDAKIKAYAREQAQKYTPVGTVLTIASKVHPYYTYGGSWAVLNPDYYPLNADRYVGCINHGKSYVRWDGMASQTSQYIQAGYLQDEWDFYTVSGIMQSNGRATGDMDTDGAPSVGDLVPMQPVPMDRCIPEHRHTMGTVLHRKVETGSGNFLRNAYGFPYRGTPTAFENGVSYGTSDIQYQSFVDAGYMNLQPSYLNCLLWQKLSNDTGAEGAEPLDGYDKPDHPLFT